MDKRIALENNTLLSLKDINGNNHLFKIVDEYGRGGTCIVYRGLYEDNRGKKHNVFIKECYPAEVNLIREKDGSLSPVEDITGLFDIYKNQYKQAFDINVMLRNISGLVNVTQNARDIYELNNTLYIIADIYEGDLFVANTDRSFADVIRILLNISRYIKNIHDNGYIYLDLKPENIFVLQGTETLIQLFDFGSMISIDDLRNTKALSCSDGFSAPEIYNGKLECVGKESDVYSIGALLFYHLFESAPSAMDRRLRAYRNYKNCIYDFSRYDIELIEKVDAFFDKTLCSYYGDRFSSMDDVIATLEDILSVAGEQQHFIIPSHIEPNKFFIGREEELRLLNTWYESSLEYIYIRGDIGEGKTSLIKQFALKKRDDGVKTIYMTYAGNICDTFCDDNNLNINRVKRNYSETVSEYFERKMTILREITKEEELLIVIDRYSYAGDVPDFVLPEAKIIIITNDDVPNELYSLELHSLDLEDIKRIVTYELNYEMDEIDEKALYKIIERYGGNISFLKVLISAINNGCISIKDAYRRLNATGIVSIATEQIDFIKDNKTIRGTIEDVLKELVPLIVTDEKQRSILRALAIFGTGGILAGDLKWFLKLENMDAINELIQLGYIRNEQNRLVLPQLILAVISTWKWSQYDLTSVRNVIEEIITTAYVEATIADYPLFVYEKVKKMRSNIEKMEQLISSPSYEQIPLKKLKQKMESTLNRMKTPNTLSERIVMVRRDTLAGRYYPHVDKMLRFGAYILQILSTVESSVLTEELEEWLLYTAVKATPINEEELIISTGERYYSTFSEKNPYHLYNVVDKMAHIYEIQGDFCKAEIIIDMYRKVLERVNVDSVAMIWYYELLLEFYDNRLDGLYDGDNEYQDNQNFQKVLDKAIKLLEKKRYKEMYATLSELYSTKATFLIRGNYSETYIRVALDKAKMYADKYTMKFSRAWQSYYLAEAWYHVYCDNNKEELIDCVVKAQLIAERTSYSKLDIIDYSYIPSANMFFEYKNKTNDGTYGLVTFFLERAIQICDENIEIKAFARKKKDLERYKSEVHSI